MPFPRSSGVLLHPTSFPSRFGIGDLGPAADQFLYWLHDAGQQFWQVLPLGPTADGASPYQSPAAFAGNALLISLERLLDDGLLTEAELKAAEIPGSLGQLRINFRVVEATKWPVLELAATRLLELSDKHPLRADYNEFCDEQSSWLADFSLFMALREANGGKAWIDWIELVDDRKRPVADAVAKLSGRIDIHRALQFLFRRQWSQLRELGRQLGIRIIGDVPIYVSYDSAEVWTQRQFFQLDDHGRSTFVAGVPPDYFSATGQLWNNPLYNWDALKADGFRWWIERIKAVLATVDYVRLDHFRGFEAYWAVPAGETTAIRGQWIPGPRDDLFHALVTGLSNEKVDGALPLIAEDLGMITNEVHALRQRFDLPGMKVLQFILPSGDPFDPANFEANSVVYTGTHDNDTTRSWLEHEIARDPHRLGLVKQFTSGNPETIAREVLEIAWKSNSNLAIAQLQDVLNLGGEARMNTPGTCGDDYGNWCWQYHPDALLGNEVHQLRELTLRSGRLSPS